jgi:hypothetical protein
MIFKKVKEYEGSRNVVLEDEEYGYDEVTLKWDGCIDLRMGMNGYKPSEDTTGENHQYIHICDIDEMIAKLQALKEYGKKHFNNEYWK